MFIYIYIFTIYWLGKLPFPVTKIPHSIHWIGILIHIARSVEFQCQLPHCTFCFTINTIVHWFFVVWAASFVLYKTIWGCLKIKKQNLLFTHVSKEITFFPGGNHSQVPTHMSYSWPNIPSYFHYISVISVYSHGQSHWLGLFIYHILKP